MLCFHSEIQGTDLPPGEKMYNYYIVQYNFGVRSLKNTLKPLFFDSTV